MSLRNMGSPAPSERNSKRTRSAFVRTYPEIVEIDERVVLKSSLEIVTSS